MRIGLRLVVLFVCFSFFCQMVFGEQERRRRRSERCSVDDVEEYYDQKLDKNYDTRRHAEDIAEKLYDGPLMREGDADGLRNLEGLVRKKKLSVDDLERIVRSHLYGDSDEFRKTLREEAARHDDDEREAAFTVLDSVYDAFGYRGRPSEEDFDACLIGNRKAHLVVAKVLIDWMERRDLD